MSAMKVLFALLFDDARLVTIVTLSVVLSYLCSDIHFHLLAAIVLWVGPMLALWVSIEHQLTLKLQK